MTDNFGRRRFAHARTSVYAARMGTEAQTPAEGIAAIDDIEALKALIARVTDRDENAFAQLYDVTCARVYGLALRIAGRRDAAEEISSDAYLQVWRQALRYDPSRGNPLAWVLTIVRSRALDYLRRRDPAETHPDPMLLQPHTISPDDPIDLMSALDRASAVHAAIAELPHNARQLIGLAFLRGLTHEEIAAHTGMPLGTVKTILRQATQALQQLLSTTLTEREEIE